MLPHLQSLPHNPVVMQKFPRYFPQAMRLVLSLFSLCFLLSGCAGYKLGNIPGAELKGVRTIYVPTVKNESYEASLNIMVTNAILRRIDNDGTFESARTKNADSELLVTITEVRKNPARRSRMNLQVVEEYEIVIEGKATFTNRVTGQRLFTDRTVRGHSYVLVQDNLPEGERQALPNAADDLAQQLISLVAEGW